MGMLTLENIEQIGQAIIKKLADDVPGFNSIPLAIDALQRELGDDYKYDQWSRRIDQANAEGTLDDNWRTSTPLTTTSSLTASPTSSATESGRGSTTGKKRTADPDNTPSAKRAKPSNSGKQPASLYELVVDRIRPNEGISTYTAKCKYCSYQYASIRPDHVTKHFRNGNKTLPKSSSNCPKVDVQDEPYRRLIMGAEPKGPALNL